MTTLFFNDSSQSFVWILTKKNEWIQLKYSVMLGSRCGFANRPANVAISYLTYNRADMAFANYGPLWRQMRKICVMKLFSRKRAESWASVREEIDSMVQTLTNQTGSQVNVGELVFALTRNITYRAAFGSFARDGQDEFVKILQEFSKLFGAFDITEFLPWMKSFGNHGFNKRLENARKSLDGFIDRILDAHIEKKKSRKPDDDGLEPWTMTWSMN